MTQSLDLNKMGLVPMNDLEMQKTNGGFPFLVVFLVSFAVGWIVGSNFAKE